MGRHPTSSSYITPVKSDGVLQAQSATEFGRGAFTLALSTTYYFPVGGQDCPFLAIHAHWDAAIILTSMTVEDCGFPESEVSNYDVSTAGLWLKKSTTTMFVEVIGTNVTNTSGVVAASGGAAGGAHWNIGNNGARRTRVAVVVAGTGGEMRLSSWGKQ